MSYSTTFDQSLDAASPSDDREEGPHRAVWSEPPKRPGGRAKFKETRNPVYRGLRRRGLAGHWPLGVRAARAPGDGVKALARHLHHRSRSPAATPASTLPTPPVGMLDAARSRGRLVRLR
ncbi:CRT-binding factor [Hordeum vulgare]|nr:CRT-binding factor [Hordeum vulgare]